MVNELRALMRENVVEAPHDSSDLAEVVRRGRGRLHRRRAGAVGGLALAVAGVAGLSGVLPGQGGSDDGPAARGSGPVGPVLRLEQADPAVRGEDYTLLASHTNDNLDEENGQYFDGVTSDGLVVYRDGPHDATNIARFALMDPSTGEKDWLPAPPVTAEWPLDLGEDRLVFRGPFRMDRAPSLLVFDREARSWEKVSWPGLPARYARSLALGPDNRLYVGFSDETLGLRETAELSEAEAGEEVDDSGATGEQLDLWSASLDDPTDVRDEGLRVGDFEFTEQHLVWTDVTNGVNDRVHVRDLATGAEFNFDPQSGDRCNQLGLGVSEGRIVMTQYCGETDGVRDDRIQVVTMSGEPVVTIQDDSLDGGVVGEGLVLVDAYGGTDGGAYVYELDSGRFLRLSTAVSKFSMGGPVPPGLVLWDEPVNMRHGARQNLARLS
jgi:hypothetical protein